MIKFLGVLKSIINEQYEYNIVNREEFQDAALELSTLNLEDDQVVYPNIDGKKSKFLFGGNEYYLFLLEREGLPVSGPFELYIEDDEDNVIGFIRGTKSKNIISFNFIHIKEHMRGKGIGSDIYEKFLNQGFIMKSDMEITDSTYSLYDKMVLYGYKPLIFSDGRVGLMK